MFPASSVCCHLPRCPIHINHTGEHHGQKDTGISLSEFYNEVARRADTEGLKINVADTKRVIAWTAHAEYSLVNAAYGLREIAIRFPETRGRIVAILTEQLAHHRAEAVELP